MKKKLLEFRYLSFKLCILFFFFFSLILYFFISLVKFSVILCYNHYFNVSSFSELWVIIIYLFYICFVLNLLRYNLSSSQKRVEKNGSIKKNLTVNTNFKFLETYVGHLIIISSISEFSSKLKVKASPYYGSFCRERTRVLAVLFGTTCVNEIVSKI